jgi:hypothetical protein
VLDARPAPPVKPLMDFPLPQPADGKEALAGQPRQVQELTVQEVKLPGGTVTPFLCWSANGKSFYCLENNGLLRRVAFPDLREERRIDLGQKCSGMARSAEGLLVAAYGIGEVWVLDPEQLNVKKRISVPSLARVASAPSLSVAFTSDDKAGFEGGTLYALDLKKGEVVREYKSPQFGNTTTGATATADGKYLITKGGGRLNRLRIQGAELEFEQSGPGLETGAQRDLQLSGDGKYVCMPTGGGNPQNLPNHPPAKSYSTYVYAVTELSRPVCVLEQGAYPEAAGFDAKGGYIYTQNFDHELIVFTMTGVEKKQYQLGARGDGVRQYLVHPDGRKVLVLTASKLYFVTVPQL